MRLGGASGEDDGVGLGEERQSLYVEALLVLGQVLD